MVFTRQAYAELEAQHGQGRVTAAVSVADDAGYGSALIMEHALGAFAVTPYGYTLPWLRVDSVDSTRKLLAELEARCMHHEPLAMLLRGCPWRETPKMTEGLLESGYVPVDHGPIALVDLEGLPSTIEGTFRKSHRTLIRQLREDPDVRVVRDIDGGTMPDFAATYQLSMERLGARDSLQYSSEYLGRLWEVFPKDQRCLIAVWRGSDLLSVALVLVDDSNVASYHLAADTELGRHASASRLTIAEAAAFARDAGCATLCLGGGLGGEKDGLWSFKSGFASSVATYRTWRRVLMEGRFEQVCRAASVVPDVRAPRFPPYATAT